MQKCVCQMVWRKWVRTWCDFLNFCLFFFTVGFVYILNNCKLTDDWCRAICSRFVGLFVFCVSYQWRWLNADERNDVVDIYLCQGRFVFTCICLAVCLSQGALWSWKVMEFRRTIFQAWKVMENSKGREKSWKMMIMSWNFYYCTEQFCKSDTTSFTKSSYEPFYLFLTVVLRADGTVTTNSGMHS